MIASALDLSHSIPHTHTQAHSRIRNCTRSTCAYMHPCPHPFLLCHTCHLTDHVHVFWCVYNLRLMLNVGLYRTRDVTVTIKVVHVPGPILYPLLLMCTCFQSCSQHIVGPSVLLYKTHGSAYGHETTYSATVCITQVIHSESFDISLIFHATTPILSS